MIPDEQIEIARRLREIAGELEHIAIDIEATVKRTRTHRACFQLARDAYAVSEMVMERVVQPSAELSAGE